MSDHAQLREWIEKIAGQKFPYPNDFHKSLKDGVILCKFLCKLSGAKPTFHEKTEGTVYKEVENISFVEQQLDDLDIDYDWSVRDLHAGNDIDSVIESLYEVARNCKQFKTFKGPYFTGPIPEKESSSDEEESKEVRKSKLSKTKSFGKKIINAITRVVKKPTPSALVGAGQNPGKLVVQIIQGRNFISGKKTGTADPYVIIWDESRDKFKKQTTVRNQTLNPTWNQSFLFDLLDYKKTKLHFEVYDSNTTGKHVFLGSVVVDIGSLHLEELVPQDKWLKLTGVKSGELRVGFIAKDFGEESSSSDYSEYSEDVSVSEDSEEEEEDVHSKKTKPVKVEKPAPTKIKKPTREWKSDLPPEERTVSYCISMLKNTVNVSSAFLSTLGELIVNMGEEWSEEFIEEDGIALLADILRSTDKKFKTAEDDKIQEAIVKCYEGLMNCEYAITEFILVPEATTALTLILYRQSIKLKRKILVLLALICNYSEKGFWVVLDALSTYKVEKQEPQRFTDLVVSLEAVEDEKFKACVLLLMNALMNSPPDRATRLLIKKEFLDLDVDSVIEEIKEKGIETENLKAQIKEFEDEFNVDEIEEYEETMDEELFNLDNPLEIAKVLRLKLGTSPAVASFRKTMQQCLVITNKEKPEEIEENWKKMAMVAERLANTGHVGDGIQEKKLQEKIILQQKQITELETKLKQAQEGGISEDNQKQINELKKEIDELKKKLEDAHEELKKRPVVEKIVEKAVENTNKVDPPTAPPVPGDAPPPPPPPVMPGDVPPPPPPPGAPGMPPPPPPPPGMPGMPPPPPPGMPGMPPPPPPPGMPGMSPGLQAVTQLPKLPEYKPSVNTKNLFMDSLSKMKVGKTIWITGGIVEKVKDVALDTESLEKLFSNEAKKGRKLDGDKKNAKPKVVTLIDAQKSNNLGLLLGYMKMEIDVIKDAIIRMDDTILSPENIAALKDKTPTSDEIDAITKYTGDPNELSIADKFYLAIKDIPRLQGRLSSWYFKHKFQQDVVSIRPDIESISETAIEILNSKRLTEFLSVVLAITNFLNANTSKKNAYGFRIGSLQKLKDTKTADGKSNLLQYLAVFCEKKYPHLLETAEDFPHLESATRVSLADVLAEFNKLKLGLQEVERELNFAEKAKYSPNDGFVQQMSNFIEAAKDELERIEESVNKMKEELKKLAEAFGENPKVIQQNPSEIFIKIRDFFTSFKIAYKDYQQKKEKEERKRLQKEKQNKMMEERAKKKLAQAQSGDKSTLPVTNSETELRRLRKKSFRNLLAAEGGLTRVPKHRNFRSQKKKLLTGSNFRERRESRLAPPPNIQQLKKPTEEEKSGIAQ